MQAALAKIAATVAILVATQASSTPVTVPLPTCTAPSYTSSVDVGTASAQAVTDYKSKLNFCLTSKENETTGIGNKSSDYDSTTVLMIEQMLTDCINQTS